MEKIKKFAIPIVTVGVICVIGAICMFNLSSCRKVKVIPSANFGFKTTGDAATYDETITEFEVGKRFYTCITIKLMTNKKKPNDYQVVVEVPKTKEVEVKGMGGLEPDSNEWDEANELTRMTFTMQGFEDAPGEKILFYGTPTNEGEAKMTVHIYDKNGEEIYGNYRVVFFQYVVQK